MKLELNKINGEVATIDIIPETDEDCALLKSMVDESVATKETDTDGAPYLFIEVFRKIHANI